MGEQKHVRSKDGMIKYLGHFNPDKYVFHLLLVLTLIFMVLYTVGTSVPAWYVMRERVTNVSTCNSADRYVDPIIRKYWRQGNSQLSLSASLWFLNVHLTNGDVVYTKFLPFLLIQQEEFMEQDSRGMLIETMFPKCLSTIVTVTFLCLGIAFTCLASNRPSRLVYYGLSSVMIVAAITAWISITIVSSEKFLLSVAYDMCVGQGVLKTSFLLQMITGSTGILAFIFGCILIHLAILINQKVLDEKYRDENEDEEFKEKLSLAVNDAEEAVSYYSSGKYMVHDY
ncbi:hypothetical protein ACF0H5_020819 [Mactra antiquata]